MSTTEPGPASVSRSWWRPGWSALIMPLLLVALAAFLFAGIADMEVADESELFGPKTVPLLAAVLCLVFAVLLAVSVIRRPEVPLDENGRPIIGLSSNWRGTGITFASLVMFAVLLLPAGWIIAGAVTFWGVTIGLGSRRYGLNILVGLALSSTIQLVFGGLLGISLPPGVMGLF
ncbi:tripartite tricarboxylate transporter TctB family protein [Nocardia ignorata]|uniref:tripartite tricarboxylate transporter TctB family protein n=1 Tax=Nocardia ignorata TaxID=145285 RepID=UPI000835FB3F|nr:tripartite tricarboxylate transporter TctB family protein [Nocardia ignorata]